MFVKKTKFRVWFFVKKGNNYKLHKKKKFKALNNAGLIYYKKKPYEPILEYPTFDNGNKRYYFFALESQAQITTYEVSMENSDSDIKDLLYTQEVLKQGFRAIKEPKLVINWIHLVFIAISCLLGGWILGNYIPIGVIP